MPETKIRILADYFPLDYFENPFKLRKFGLVYPDTSTEELSDAQILTPEEAKVVQQGVLSSCESCALFTGSGGEIGKCTGPHIFASRRNMSVIAEIPDIADNPPNCDKFGGDMKKD